MRFARYNYPICNVVVIITVARSANIRTYCAKIPRLCGRQRHKVLSNLVLVAFNFENVISPGRGSRRGNAITNNSFMTPEYVGETQFIRRRLFIARPSIIFPRSRYVNVRRYYFSLLGVRVSLLAGNTGASRKVNWRFVRRRRERSKMLIDDVYFSYCRRITSFNVMGSDGPQRLDALPKAFFRIARSNDDDDDENVPFVHGW